MSNILPLLMLTEDQLEVVPFLQVVGLCRGRGDRKQARFEREISIPTDLPAGQRRQRAAAFDRSLIG
jgi:hypothetical protein